jgi:hypothetical protein
MYATLIKISAVLALVIAAYVWHVNTLNNAVEQAVINERNSLVVQYSKQAIKLQDNAYLAEVQLQDKIKRITDDKNKALSDSNAKYNDLLKWLQSQSNGGSTGKQTSVSNSTSTGESTKGTNGQGLLQGNATDTIRLDGPLVDLIEFARSTEELKLYLLTCERQYDQVLEDQRKFRLRFTEQEPLRLENMPKTD